MEIYLHMPFCRRKCRYCDFASYAGETDRMPAYVDTLLLEAAQQQKWVSEPIETLYLGGGTPSLLPAPLLEKMIREIRSLFPVREDAEFTAEANPGTVTPEWLETAAASGINRLSLGMQAYQDSLLRLLGRIHCFREVEEAVYKARKAGFQNISLDLIFGIPGQTEADWEETLAHALLFEPDHISAYGLIPEEGTPLTEEIRAGRLALPEPETERMMYETLKKRLRDRGYEQYEISNFAKPGAACRHNIGYWTQIPYLGLGLSAASMLNLRRMPEGITYQRTRNPVTFEAYDRLVRGGESRLRQEESILPEEARFETMMLGLRMKRGISEAAFLQMHGVSLESCYGQKLRSFQKQGLMAKEKDRWFMTSRGMDIQNAILVELMDD